MSLEDLLTPEVLHRHTHLQGRPTRRQSKPACEAPSICKPTSPEPTAPTSPVELSHSGPLLSPPTPNLPRARFQTTWGRPMPQSLLKRPKPASLMPACPDSLISRGNRKMALTQFPRTLCLLTHPGASSCGPYGVVWPLLWGTVSITNQILNSGHLLTHQPCHTRITTKPAF